MTQVWFALSRLYSGYREAARVWAWSLGLTVGDSRLWQRVPTVNVLESTLEWTKGEVIGSHAPCFSMDSASGMSLLELWPLAGIAG